MVINRAGALAGALTIGGCAFLMWTAGGLVRAQQRAVSGSATVHSIKITLAPSQPSAGDCVLRPPLPERSGVYPKDTVTFNVENGCAMDATISISNFNLTKGTVRLFDERATWPRDVPVASNSRERVDVMVAGEDWKDERDELEFEYTISLKGSPGVPGVVKMCRRPPCT